MGTWGSGINENDTAFDVTETFFEMYNSGMQPDQIHKEIFEQFADSLNDTEDCDNVLFPLAECLWKVCALDNDTLQTVRERIESGANIEICRSLGANDDFLKKRTATLNKLLVRLATPKDKPKARKKPPVPIASPYRAGCCLSFRYPDGTFGGAMVVSAGLYNTKGNIYLSLTDIRSSDPPTTESFERARMIDFKWESVWGQAERYEALKIDGRPHTGRIGQHCLGYNSKQERHAFFEQFGSLFTIVGELPPFTQILCSTGWIDIQNEDAAQAFDYYYDLRGEEFHSVSNETLKELASICSSRPDRE